MIWDKFFAAMFAVFFLSVTASAQIVTVQGSGTSESEAIKDAKRNAVEQVIGAKIQSESMMIDSELVYDTVKTRSAGYVTGCEVVKKNSSGGFVEITARVNVSDEPDSELMKDLELVMTLNDPRISVQMEYYGDDGGETSKKYPAMCEAAIREELIKRGFSHVVDRASEVDYVMIGRLSVEKAREIKLPNWRSIGGDDFRLSETGLSRSTATVDCKIKKVDTDEIVGEFQARGDGMDATGNGVSQEAVSLMASNAAQEVRKILSREASKVFTEVAS